MKVISLLTAILTLAVAAHAQTSRGTVSGTVTDPSGAVVTRARVALTHTQKGVRLTATTNEAGIYRFDALDLGSYELKVTHPGFNAFLATELGVEANRTTVLDVRLEVGSEATTIRVSAEAEELTVRDGPLRGGNFLPSQVRQLPLIGLSPLSLARTLPGVVEPSGSVVWNQAGPEYSVNGQRTRGNNYLLDGAENNDIAMAGVAQPFNIADAVEEVSVQTGNFSVEFGRAAGGVLNVVTKSGTNSVHGRAFWRYQSQRL